MTFGKKVLTLAKSRGSSAQLQYCNLLKFTLWSGPPPFSGLFGHPLFDNFSNLRIINRSSAPYSTLLVPTLNVSLTSQAKNQKLRYSRCSSSKIGHGESRRQNFYEILPSSSKYGHWESKNQIFHKFCEALIKLSQETNLTSKCRIVLLVPLSLSYISLMSFY